jgi:hypothetical protein
VALGDLLELEALRVKADARVVELLGPAVERRGGVGAVALSGEGGRDQQPFRYPLDSLASRQDELFGGGTGGAVVVARVEAGDRLVVKSQLVV